MKTEVEPGRSTARPSARRFARPVRFVARAAGCALATCSVVSPARADIVSYTVNDTAQAILPDLAPSSTTAPSATASTGTYTVDGSPYSFSLSVTNGGYIASAYGFTLGTLVSIDSFVGTGVGITAGPLAAGTLIGPNTTFLGNTVAGEPVYRTSTLTLFTQQSTYGLSSTGTACVPACLQQTFDRLNTGTAGNNLYFGIQTTSATPTYGWIELSITPSSQQALDVRQSLSTVSLVAYAYETSGGPIQAGAVAPVPLPGSLWLLGSSILGLVGVARGRRAGGIRGAESGTLPGSCR